MSAMMFAWIIPVFPLAAFILIAFGGYRNHRFSQNAAVLGVFSSFIAFQLIFWITLGQGQTIEAGSYSIQWINLGFSQLRLGTYIDANSALMMFAVPIVCSLVFIYSIGYMHGDASYSRFYAYVSLFAFAMLGLVICDNLLALFVFWEIMGTCSYLLIGFWNNKPKPMAAALKAFFVTKIADIFMLLGLLILYSETGTLAYRDLFQTEVLHELAITPSYFQGISAATLISLLLFAGTVGKSAQFPLHVWLPDAMEGPTPASALIHAATMVSAGIFLLIRMFPLLHMSQALPIIATVGTITAIFAAVIAVTQDDIKRVLAYSTISQLGYMVAAVGVGAYKASLFHLLTHAFFKALLFMAAGSVIHGVEHGYHVARGHAVPTDGSDTFFANSMLQMGGLLQRMPVTAVTYFVGGITLAGFPFITSGFWSKDAILTQAWYANRQVFWTLAAAAGLTAFYTMRQLCLVFLGNPRTQASYYARENPNTMLIPLLVLAFFSLVVGWVGIPDGFPLLSRIVPDFIGSLFESPIFHASLEADVLTVGVQHSSGNFAWIPMLVGIALPIIGFTIGWLLYGRVPLEAGDEEPLEEMMASIRFKWLFRLIQNRLFIDEIYTFIFIKPFIALANLTSTLDAKFVDQIVITVARIGAGVSAGVQKVDDTILNPDLSKIKELSLSQLFEWVDKYMIDEFINILGFIGEFISTIFQQIDERLLDGLLRRISSGAQSIGSYVRRLQNGLISDYLWNAFLMVLLLIAAISLLQ
jgi:NADH-quinone oxidoreductase subunit L